MRGRERESKSLLFLLVNRVASQIKKGGKSSPAGIYSISDYVRDYIIITERPGQTVLGFILQCDEKWKSAWHWPDASWQPYGAAMSSTSMKIEGGHGIVAFHQEQLKKSSVGFGWIDMRYWTISASVAYGAPKRTWWWETKIRWKGKLCILFPVRILINPFS